MSRCRPFASPIHSLGEARTVAALGLLLAALAAPAARAQEVYTGLPAPLQRIAFEQRLGESVDLSLAFHDAEGRRRELGELVGKRPAVLALVYYECPMLCSLTVNGLVSSLRAIDLSPGDDFEVLVVSIDPGEGAALAGATRDRALDSYARPGTEAGWHFLTGEPEAIAELTESVGFRYSYDEETDEYAHTAGVVVLTPDGSVSRYLMGIEYPPKDLRLSLVESAGERIGTLVDQALLFCYRYDPETGTYSAATLNLVRAGGVLTVVAILLYVIVMVRRERSGAALGESGHVA